MKYIEEIIEDGKRVGYKCSHPMVEKLWETGGCGRDPESPFYTYTHVLLKDGSRHDFSFELPRGIAFSNLALQAADDFLQTLSPE